MHRNLNVYIILQMLTVLHVVDACKVQIVSKESSVESTGA